MATALDGGGKAFYTTPLKALSSQKFGDFSRVRRRRVGLLTGDNSINGNAPVVVMTTEVLRNAVYAPSSALEGLRFVVLDEVHYLQDPYRGAVWEEVIIHLPPDVRLVCLSATVSSAEEFARAWVETVGGETAAVIGGRRPVRLEHLYMVGERGSDQVHLLPTFVERDGEARPVKRRASRLRRWPAARRAGVRAAGSEPAAVRDRRGAVRAAHAAGDHVRVQPRRVRSGRPAVRVRQAPG